MATKIGYVYILASQRNGAFYLGVTSDLAKRIRQYKEGAFDGFSKRYGVHRLVYVEEHDRVVDAIAREKRLKKWRRAWKLELIEGANPGWRDLYEDLALGG